MYKPEIVIKSDHQYQVEQIRDDSYMLWRLSYPSREWKFVGDIIRDQGGNYNALITKPLDPEDGSDMAIVYIGTNLDAALGALWVHRFEAA